MSLSPPYASLQRMQPIAPSQRARRVGVAFPTLLLFCVYALPIVVTVRPVGVPILDPDIWWHLRVGQWVSENGAVPHVDPFSRGPVKPWVAYSWLYELLVYRLYDWFGLAGIVVYRAAFSLAVVAALHGFIRRREPRLLVSSGLTVLATFALAPLFSERPWLLTILFSTFTLDAILAVREERTSRWIWLLPVGFVLWANSHVQFVYGLLLLGLACLTPWLDERLGRPREISGQAKRRLLVLSALCAAATLVNPYHVRLYGVVVEYAIQSGAFHYVNELRAMEFRETPDWMVLLLGGASAFVLGRRRRLDSFEVLLLLCAGAFAFRSRRDLWLLVIASAAILASKLGRRVRISCHVPAFRCWLGAALLSAGLTGLVAWQRDLSTENLRSKAAEAFPVEAAAFVAASGYQGPLFNDFNWGGYLIWNLPQYPVVVDGRTNLHGDAAILRIGNTWAAGADWRGDPELNAARVIIAKADSPLAVALEREAGFRLVHRDAIARVFLRETPASAGVPGK